MAATCNSPYADLETKGDRINLDTRTKGREGEEKMAAEESWCNDLASEKRIVTNSFPRDREALAHLLEGDQMTSIPHESGDRVEDDELRLSFVEGIEDETTQPDPIGLDDHYSHVLPKTRDVNNREGVDSLHDHHNKLSGTHECSGSEKMPPTMAADNNGRAFLTQDSQSPRNWERLKAYHGSPAAVHNDSLMVPHWASTGRHHHESAVLNREASGEHSDYEHQSDQAMEGLKKSNHSYSTESIRQAFTVLRESLAATEEAICCPLESEAARLLSIERRLDESERSKQETASELETARRLTARAEERLALMTKAAEDQMRLLAETQACLEEAERRAEEAEAYAADLNQHACTAESAWREKFTRLHDSLTSSFEKRLHAMRLEHEAEQAEVEKMRITAERAAKAGEIAFEGRITELEREVDILRTWRRKAIDKLRAHGLVK